MNFLKRAELWVLLLIIIAGLVWVFNSRHPDDDEASAGAIATSSGSTDAPLKILRSVVERDYGNARLDIEIHIRNENEEKLVCQPPKVKLFNAKGKEAPSFFLPFEPFPEVPPKSAQDVKLRYWLEASDLNGELKLLVLDGSVEVKSAKAFDLNSIKNTEKKTIKPGEW